MLYSYMRVYVIPELWHLPKKCVDLQIQLRQESLSLSCPKSRGDEVIVWIWKFLYKTTLLCDHSLRS